MTDTNAPDRIWVDDERPIGGSVHVNSEWSEGAEKYMTPYVRADLHAALVAERDAWKDEVEVTRKIIEQAKAQRDALRAQVEWQDIASAPKDGTPVLVKIKDDLTPWGVEPGHLSGMDMFAGLQAVMRNRGDIMAWCFDTTDRRGGFPAEWLDGWRPTPNPPVQP